MPEFKFCALKRQLPRAFQLELDSQTNVKEEVPEEREEKKEEDAVLNVKDNEEEINKTEKLALKDNDAKEEVKIEKNEKQKDERNETKEMPKEKEEKNKEKKVLDVKMVTGEGKSDEEIITPSGKQYIDFRRFCDILKIFNPKTPIDSKVNCTIVIKLVYFRLYDVDNDGKVSKGDFRRILIDLVPEDMLNEDKVNLKDEAKEDVERIINLMFKEIVGNEKRKFIEYDEFQKILWQTNIDKTCVIHFETI
jgi:Ca2+-binding EF-hand superfamily protein